MFASLKTYLLELNLFESSAEDIGERNAVRRLHLVSTRVYLLVCVFALAILGFSLWLSPWTTTLTLQSPSQAQFETLPIDAYCPCTYAAPTYGDFISLRPEFHQVCQSDFVTDRWIKTIFSGSNATYFLPYDFRNQGSALFLSLANFCRLANQTVVENILAFQTSSFISPQALSKVVLEFQAQSAFDQFKLRVPNEFNTQLRLLRELIVSNQFVSALHTSLRPMYHQTSLTSPIRTFIQYVVYDGETPCECYKDIECTVEIPLSIINEFQTTENAFFYTNDTRIQMIIPGLRAACTPVDSLLGSSLECFYNQSCIEELLSFFDTDENFIAMDVSKLSQRQVNATVRSIVNSLLVEKWEMNTSYENYFTRCAPVSCSYSTWQRRSAIFVMMKLISVLSTLTAALRIVIPNIVQFLSRKKATVRNPAVVRKFNGLLRAYDYKC